MIIQILLIIFADFAIIIQLYQTVINAHLLVYVKLVQIQLFDI